MIPFPPHCPRWLAAALLGASLHAAAAPEIPPPLPPRMAPSFSACGFDPAPLPPDLGLSEAQQDRLFALHHAQAPRLRQLQREADAGLRALHALAAADSFDAARAGTAAEHYGRALAALLRVRTELEARFRAVLTPAQRQALDGGPPVPGCGGDADRPCGHDGADEGHRHPRMAELRP